MSKSFSFLSAGVVFLLVYTSCTTSNKTAYFNNIPDTTFASTNGGEPILIRKNDILTITISSLNAEASSIFNQGNYSGGGGSGTVNGSSRNQGMGYLVDNDGYILLPVLGNIKAVGITRKELRENITNTILEKKLLIDPIVDIRYLNYEVTVIGEVGHPTVITVPNEKISLIKALGLAGDLTIYGRRDNILLIREEDGLKKTRHIDLNSSNFITSPYFYLQPNDVVYVEPNKAKAVTGSLSRQLLPSVLSGLSLLVLVITRLRN